MRNNAVNLYRSDRAKAWRNLMVAAINDGLANGVFDLAGNGPDWRDEEERHRKLPPDQSPQSTFDLAGRPVIARFDNCSFDEVWVNVIVTPTERGRDGIACGFYRWAAAGDGAAFASGWFERRTGKYLMNGSSLFYCRRDLTPRLAALKIEPQGYRDHGKFFL
jgi:hypothetical protein